MAKRLPQPGLRRSLEIQARVVFALLMREVMTRYGRHNIGFLWLFVEPMLFTLAVTTLWSLVSHAHSSTIPIVAFGITGYSSVLLWRNMSSRCVGAIGPNLALMYHRNVKADDVYISRMLLEIVGSTISFLVLSLLFISLGMIQPPEDLVKVIFAWALLAWFSVALSLLVGAMSERSEFIEKIWSPASYILFPLSGAAFLVEALPPPAQEFVLYLPMVHGLELLREGYFGSHFTAVYDLTYMVSVTLVMSLIGLADLRSLGRRVTPE